MACVLSYATHYTIFRPKKQGFIGRNGDLAAKRGKVFFTGFTG